MSLSEEDMARIRELVEHGPKSLGTDPRGGWNRKVDAETCAEIRRRTGELTHAEMADRIGVSRQTVSFHARGDCSHPKLSDGGEQ